MPETHHRCSETDSAAPQAATCPLCQRPNGCAMAAGDDAQTCWCQTQTFSADLLARVPTAAPGLACICQACARAHEAAAEPPTTACP